MRRINHTKKTVAGILSPMLLEKEIIGSRRLRVQRGQEQWQQGIKRQWRDVLGNEPTTIKIIEPQPQSEVGEDLHVMIYMEDMNPACILVDIKDGSGLLHRGLQHHQRPVTGFEVLAQEQIDPHRWDDALFRRNGRIWRGWDRVRHQHGWHWSILLEDDYRQDEGDENALMQRVIRGEEASSSCDGNKLRFTFFIDELTTDQQF